jgi:hypothetical protein
LPAMRRISQRFSQLYVLYSNAPAITFVMSGCQLSPPGTDR